MEEKQQIRIAEYESPCGTLILGSYGDELCLCDWQLGGQRGFVLGRLLRTFHTGIEPGATEVTRLAAAQLDEYFAGQRRSFTLPLVLAGTDFQKKVWNGLLQLPFGKTCSYSELAERLGMPRAFRPVSNAIRANALSLFVPCHRVIGINHTLTGYAGGLDAKRFLLELEKKVSASNEWFG